ncbi:MAG: hypothetical protein R3C01_14005 [Planctomycetaceae bacterium]
MKRLQLPPTVADWSSRPNPADDVVSRFVPLVNPDASSDDKATLPNQQQFERVSSRLKTQLFTIKHSSKAPDEFSQRDTVSPRKALPVTTDDMFKRQSNIVTSVSILVTQDQHRGSGSDE